MTTCKVFGKDGAGLSDAVAAYHDDGYAVIRGVLDDDLVGEMKKHVSFLTSKFPTIPGEHLHHHIMRNDPFWVRLVSDERLLNLAARFAPFLQKENVPNEETGVALFSSHYFCKRPLSGKRVAWHQDGSYWPLRPMNVITLWIAVDDSDTENGCLKVVRGSHRNDLETLVDLEKDGSEVLGAGTHTDADIDHEKVVNICCKAGDIEIHHPNIVHASDANRSNRRRAGLTVRYISPSTQCWDEDQPVLLLRGQPVEGVNNYRSWPKYRQGYDMPFKGCEEWNLKRYKDPKDELEYFSRVDFAQMDKETIEKVDCFVNALGGRAEHEKTSRL
mmetsp:Transcript_41331/g.66399  ORF Transcript_41331/g.66399 Transcript_41331/m.66399 type:complete len:330 (-) Transcript_41331:2787-3776(-)